MVAKRKQMGAKKAQSAVQTKKTKENRQDEKLRLQAQIMAQVNDAVISTDLDGLVTGWNKGAQRILGYTAKEAIGKHISFLYPPEKHKFLEKEMIESLKKKGTLKLEDKSIGKSGREVHLFLSLSLIKDEAGGTIGMLGYGIDVTRRELNEKAMEEIREQVVEEKNRLEAVMEALPVGVAVVDEKGGNIRANMVFEQIWGGPRPNAKSIKDYAKYKACWVETGKAVKPEEWASAQAVRKGVTVTNQLMAIQRFDGTHAFVLNSASPIRNTKGKITGSAVAIQNITELRKTQETLRQSNEELNRLNKAMVGRELRIIELKKEVNELCDLNGQKQRYPLKFEKENENEKNETRIT